MTIESTLERIAVALEKQVEQYEAMLNRIGTQERLESAIRVQAGGLDIGLVAPSGVHKVGERITAMDTPAPEATIEDITAKWNPLNEKVMAKYGAEKRTIMEALAAKLGITFDPKLTGGQLHQLLLDHVGVAEEPAAPAEPAVEDFDFDAAPVVEEPKKYTAEEVRAAMVAYCKKVGAKDVTPAMEIVKETTGKAKFSDVAPEEYHKIMAKIGE